MYMHSHGIKSSKCKLLIKGMDCLMCPSWVTCSNTCVRDSQKTSSSSSSDPRSITRTNIIHKKKNGKEKWKWKMRNNGERGSNCKWTRDPDAMSAANRWMALSIMTLDEQVKRGAHHRTRIMLASL